MQDRRFVDVAMRRATGQTNARNGVAVVEVLEAADVELDRRVSDVALRHLGADVTREPDPDAAFDH